MKVVLATLLIVFSMIDANAKTRVSNKVSSMIQKMMLEEKIWQMIQADTRWMVDYSKRSC